MKVSEEIANKLEDAKIYRAENPTKIILNKETYNMLYNEFVETAKLYMPPGTKFGELVSYMGLDLVVDENATENIVVK